MTRSFTPTSVDSVNHNDLNSLQRRRHAGAGISQPGKSVTALPWVKGSLAATWFSGWTRCPEGRLLQYVHAGYASQYERDRSFYFEKGTLIGEYLTLNPPEPINFRIFPDGTRTCISDLGPLHYELEDPLAGEDVSNAHLVWGRPPEGDEDPDYLVGGYTML